VPNGFQWQVPHTHHGLRCASETAWVLALLTANDGAATPMTGFFPAG
jgi:hypothetical protein